MQVLLGAATLFFCCCHVAAFGSQDLGFKTQTDHVSYLLSSYLKRLTETESNSAAERRRMDAQTRQLYSSMIENYFNSIG
jgi:hypothetical protein